MTTKVDLRKAVSAIWTLPDLKDFFHEYGGLTITEARERVEAMLRKGNDNNGDGDNQQPLSRAGIARAAREVREFKQQRFDLLYSQVQTAAHAKWLAYDGPKPAEDCWTTIAGKQTILAPWQRVRHGFALELAQQLEKELDDCPNDDEVEALLIRKGWPDDLISRYLEGFGKAESNGSH
jgi:hypothetical protein